MPDETDKPASILLTPPVRKVLWAAMVAMVQDIHAPQDRLTEEEWSVAETVLRDLDVEMNKVR